VDVSLLIRQRLSELSLEQKDLAVAAQVTDGLCAPIRRAGTSTRLRDTRSCRRWTASTTVPVFTTMHRRRMASSFEQISIPRSGQP
jgi:hypothetical protein